MIQLILVKGFVTHRNVTKWSKVIYSYIDNGEMCDGSDVRFWTSADADKAVLTSPDEDADIIHDIRADADADILKCYYSTINLHNDPLFDYYHMHFVSGMNEYIFHSSNQNSREEKRI